MTDIKGINMREKILELFYLTTGNFDQLVESVAIEAGDGNAIDLDDPSLPENLRKFVLAIKTKLYAARKEFEDATLEVYAKQLTETDVDTILEFQKSETGKKLKEIAGQLHDEIIETATNWRNSTLDKHREELSRILDVEEPEPMPPMAA